MADQGKNSKSWFFDEVPKLYIEYDNGGGSSARMNANQGDLVSLEQDLFTESKEDLEIIIKPNPFQNDFSVFIESPNKDLREADIRIVNLSGKMVYQQSGIPLEEEYFVESYTGWPDGVYFIQIQSGEYYKTLKVIKE